VKPERARWTWWLSVVFTALYILLPGPLRSPFSGVPLSSKATALFVALLIVAIFTAMFRPHRAMRMLWPAALLLLLIAKLLLAPALVMSGWRGVYSTATRSGGAYLPMKTQWFQNHGAASQAYRIDRVIDFDGVTFGLSFLNEAPSPPLDSGTGPRDVSQPLIVHWNGYAYAAGERPLAMSVSGNGRVVVDVDGKRALDLWNPANAAVNVTLAPGQHAVSIVYVKPVGMAPRARIETGEAVTIAPVDPQRMRASIRADRTINILGLLTLLLLFAAWVDAYSPLRILFLDELWARPDKVMVIALAAFFLMRGLEISIPLRHATVEVRVGDDPLAYEGYARWIARNGLMMLDDSGKGTPYFFYPLYSYGLAAAHILFGDDFSTVNLFNYLCITAAVLLVWAILRDHLSRMALACLLLFIVAPFAAAHLGWYATSGFSDNLFVPMVLAMLLICMKAFERRSVGWLFATGLTTALAAAARASLMTHLAFVCAAVLIYTGFGPLERRLRGCAAFVSGFVVALAPFTIRNWLVSKKLVLLVFSIVEIPHFLFLEEREPSFLVNGRFPTFTESMGQFVHIYMSDPIHYTWIELRKILFTLGVTSLGPSGINAPMYLIIFPILFVFALWLRQVPRPVAATLLAFCASHMLAMVMASPWTYGYKTMLPFILATMIGSAFLLRHLRAMASVPLAVATPLPARPSVTVIVTGAHAAERVDAIKAASIADEILIDESAEYGAAVQRSLPAAKGDLIAVVPSDPAYAPGEIRRLIAFGNDFDAVFGDRQSEMWLASLRVSGALAKWVGSLFDSKHTLNDVGSRMWVMRRDALEEVRAAFREQGNELPLEALILVLGRGFRIMQVPISYRPELPDRSFSWLLPSLRVITSRARERKA